MENAFAGRQAFDTPSSSFARPKSSNFDLSAGGDKDVRRLYIQMKIPLECAT